MLHYKNFNKTANDYLLQCVVWRKSTRFACNANLTYFETPELHSTFSLSCKPTGRECLLPFAGPFCLSVCLSVCILYVCQTFEVLTWKFIFAHPVYLQATKVKIVCEGYQVKVKVTGAEKSKMPILAT